MADRAHRHPLPLRPAAGNAAGDLGHQPDPAAGGALDLRPLNREVANAELDVRHVRSASSTRRSPTYNRLFIIVFAMVVFSR
jgi:hypothetical protein